MVSLIFRITLAGVFVAAAWHALRDWGMFRAIVAQYRILPAPLASLAGWGMPCLQGLAALLLLMAPLAGAMLGLCLMLSFAAAIGINVQRGRTAIDCGCGGAPGQRLSWGLVGRNLLLCAALAVVLAVPGGAPVGAAQIVTVAGGACFLLIAYFAANQLLANAQAQTMSTRSWLNRA